MSGEHTFSRINNYVSSGASNASNHRLSAQQLHPEDIPDTVSDEVIKEERRFTQELKTWYKDETNDTKQQDFFVARYLRQLGDIKCEQLRDATSGPAAVPRCAAELIKVCLLSHLYT